MFFLKQLQERRSIAFELIRHTSHLHGGNYKVQDVVSQQVFVSRDVIFEEGKPSQTLASVGEQIPTFDAGLTPLTNTDHHLADNPLGTICLSQHPLWEHIINCFSLDHITPEHPITCWHYS